ncbi:hypothetical protein [Roseovarius ramblicola]|uniref:Uncharacterized protein n=1 Tax=Roseovarius ramblicola TaxID=2022336 RepID=A0ABV5HYF8_9RHOB
MTGPSPTGAQGADKTSGSGALDRLSGDALAAALAATDWSEAPLAGLGRAMARRDLDLATALCVFFRGAPERFNYLPKPDVPDRLRPVARQLDNICLRINSGFYLPAPGARLACRAPLDRWLGYQRADRHEGRCGRWVLDEARLAPLFDTAWCQAPPAPHPEREMQSLWRAVLAPFFGMRAPRAFGRPRK